MKDRADEKVIPHFFTPRREPFSVSEYLDEVNATLSALPAAVRGEVSSLEVRDRYLFFKIQEAGTKSILPCFMWRQAYKLSNVSLAEGIEVVCAGVPKIYKGRGSFTFEVEAVEIAGEGALKKAYDALRGKLEAEGIFSPERKRRIPQYVHTIGLLTSESGAVIHDFVQNLGKFGYKIVFHDTRVEGQFAEQDILKGLRFFENADIDVLVVIRGGGSLESLAPWNRENIVRAIADFPKPVLVGIGHELDVPLAALAADYAVSTPTAVCHVLNAPWQEARVSLSVFSQKISDCFRSLLAEKRNFLAETSSFFVSFVVRFSGRLDVLGESVRSFHNQLYIAKKLFKTRSESQWNELCRRFGGFLEKVDGLLQRDEKSFEYNNPKRHLSMGYSIVRKRGRVMKGVSGIEAGDSIALEMADGTIEAEIKTIYYDTENQSK